MIRILGIVLVAGAAWALSGCSTSQVEVNDPTVYVPGVYCPDQNGHAGKDYPWTRLIDGNICCADQGVPGGGQCPANTSCLNTDTCSSPLPGNDEPMMARLAVSKRMGLQ